MAVERNSVVVEEYLQAIYSMQKSEDTVKSVLLVSQLNSSPSTVHATLNRMQRDGLVTMGPKKEIHLTALGLSLAESLVYRHQLVETFLCEHLGIDWHEVHQHAHILEHGLTPLVVEKLAIFLGNPAHCPHGSPIPGNSPPKEMKFLSQVEPSETFEVVMVDESLEDSSELMQFFQKNQLVPGQKMVLIERIEATRTLKLQHNKDVFSLPFEVSKKIGVVLKKPSATT